MKTSRFLKKAISYLINGNFKKFIKTPTGYYISVTILLILLVGIVDLLSFLISISENAKNIWLNIHASIVEVFLLGLFITKYNNLTQNNKEIKEWKEQIDDYREWLEPEASYRIRGLIRRLTKRGELKLDLSKCFLVKTDFHGIIMTETNFSDSDLSGSDFSFANLQRVNLARTNLNYSKFIKADLSGADLTKAKFLDADLTEVVLLNAKILFTNLYDAVIENANLENANLTEALLVNAKMMHSNLAGAILVKAKMIGSNLTGANLKDALLIFADLSGAIMENANLKNANFENANLSSAILFGVNLVKTNLKGVNLKGAQVNIPNWIEKLREFNCTGIEEIEAKYYVSKNEFPFDDGNYTIIEKP